MDIEMNIEMDRTPWDAEKIRLHFEKRFFNLLNTAFSCHKENFMLDDIEFCALSNIKTGSCPEDCAYCPQSGHYKTGIVKESLLNIDTVLLQAKKAKANGAKRFCLGAAWRTPPKKDFAKVLNMIASIKNLGLETCVTLGMLDSKQALALSKAGLDFYNHNLDTSPNFYPSIISTRTFKDRLETIKNVVASGINVCCGGILGMGESRTDRIEFLLALQNLPNLLTSLRSIPINQLIPIPGTPLAEATPLDSFEFIRTIAVARLMFPKARIRLSAGRENMTEEMQAWCFMAGANSIFIGEKLLTTKNSSLQRDIGLLKKLGMQAPKTR